MRCNFDRNMPSTIAVCYDVDPHETHVKCCTILQHATRGIKGLEKVVLYKSAWGNRTAYQSLRSPWIQWKVKNRERKREALACHESQLSMKVHDGFGNNIFIRGNLDEESYTEITIEKTFTHWVRALG